MRKSNVLVALGGVTTALFAACGGGSSGTEPAPSTTSTGTVAPVTTTTTSGSSPTSSTSGPAVTPSTSGPVVQPSPSTGATGMTGPTGAPTTSTGGTSSSGPVSTTTTAEPTGPAGSSETTSSETGETTSGPLEPPDGAYEACSGAAMPNIVMTPFLTAPKVQLPIDIDFPPGQPDKVYVVERGGALKRFDLAADGSVPGNATTILEVTTSTQSECGFFAVAFHPNFDGETEKRFYVSYMPTCPQNIFGAGGSSSLDEYELNGDSATQTQTLVELAQPQGNHNGGSLEFGPDGYLYFGLGDGGNSNDTGDGHSANGNGQDVTEPLGSILRFDVDSTTPPAGNLSMADVGQSVDGRILHYGLRNPWRFTFDRLTGDLWIGDVGQDTREEVNMLPAGTGPTNFGWAVREGKGARPNNNYSLVAGTTAFEPIYDYATAASGGGIFKGSVTGGYVYRGQKIPGLWGRYLFADFVRADFYALTAGPDGAACDVVENAINNTEISDQSLASFGEDNDGELYVIGLSDGVFRLDPGQ